MFGTPRARKYTSTQEAYPLMETLAVAVAVDRAQGFIKSKRGYYDEENQVVVNDNRLAALLTLRVMNGKIDEVSKDGEKVQTFKPMQEDYATAQEIFTYFDQKLLMEKMSDNLVKVGKDGNINRFDEDMARIFGSDKADINRDLAMIVSLPNSRRIANKRDEMDEFHQTHAANGYIGAPKQRMNITGKVMDVKYIPRYQIHLATVVTPEGKIAKFFMNEKMNDRAKSMVDTTVTFLGTVKKQDVNTFTNCQETMFNRVKFNDS